MNANGAPRFLLSGLVPAAIAALGTLIALNTEWVDIEVPRPVTGPAATDELYVLQRLLEGIGAQAVRRGDLAELPPITNPMVLQAWIWGVFPERDRALQDWVQGGGQLIITGWLARGRNGKELAWLPVEAGKPPAPKAAVVPAPDPQAGNPIVPGLRVGEPACIKVSEPEGVAPAYEADLNGNGSPRSLELCGTLGFDTLATRHEVKWALQGESGIEALRVAVGAGSVTVLPRANILENRLLLRGDNPQIAVAALQAGPGARVWIIADNHPTGLLAWSWDHGAAAVLAGLAALLLWLWRASDRFGPRALAPGLARRSMVEQIRGTAAFLWQRSPGALHAAQLRALEDVARRQLRGYAQLDRADRAQALATASGVAALTITQAMNFGAAPNPRGLPRALMVLETVRRALLENAGRRPLASSAVRNTVVPTKQESSP
jgi:hypothetical protein